jgi:uncharacterized protein involved in outer membrane biogenesis
VKIFLYGLLAFVVLVVAAALIGPSFVDWNAHKARIAAEVRKATGRDLTIDGDVHLAILPAPALSADQVSIANIPGGSAPYMAQVRELRVRIALLPLIQGRVQVESVSLVAPEILLEELADGRRNWEFGATARAGDAAEARATEAGLADQIQLDSFTISDGNLTYRNAASGREEHIEGLDAEIVAESLAGPLTTRGGAVVRGIETEFDLAAGRLVKAGATPLNLTLRLPQADAAARFAGSVSVHPGTLRFRGHLESQGSNLAAALDALSAARADALPAPLAQSFALQSDIAGDLAGVSTSDLRLQLGEARLSGDAALELGEIPDLTVSLSATRIDLDQLLALELPARSTAPRPAPSAADEASAGNASSPPRNLKARLELAVEGVIYRGQAIRQLRFDASLQDGKITVGQAMALLPGGSDLSLTGVLSPGETGARFSGRVESLSDNFRGLAAWLGADLARVPADRLRRMSFSSRIEAGGQQIALQDIDLRVDLTRVTGGVVAALRQRVGLGIGLAVDGLNLDAYLPVPPPAAGQGQGSTREAAAAPAASRPTEAFGALLERYDANLDFRIGSLTYGGVAAKDLHLDGTLQNGALTLRQSSIGALPGARAAYRGAVHDLGAMPRLDGDLEIEVSDPRRLAKALQLDWPLAGRLGRFSLNSRLAGTRENLAVDSVLAALGGRVGLTGTITPAAEPVAFDLAVTAQHPDLPGLLSALQGETALKPDFGGVDLSGQVAGTPLEIKMTGLAGSLGPLELSGQVAAELDRPKPFIRANLMTGELPLAALLVPAAGAEQAGAAGGRQGRAAKAGASHWSRDAIDLAAWHAVDGELALMARHMKLGRTAFEDVALTAELEDGVLKIERLTASLHGGVLQMVGKLAAGEGLEADVAITALEVDLGQLLREQADFARLSGPVDLKTELTTSGGSEAELISALAGRGEFTGKLEVEVEPEERLDVLALDLLGAKVGAVRNVSDATTTLLGSFAGAPAELTGGFTVAQGVVVTNNARIDGASARAVTRARADLPTWRLDSQTDVFQASNPDVPYLTANLKGPLDAPDVRLGGLPFRNPAPAPDGVEDGQPNGDLMPLVPKKLKTQDVLKSLLKGVRG